jgi:hypothetical protein
MRQTLFLRVHDVVDNMAFRNLFKNDLVLVGTNLAVVAGFATLLGNASFLWRCGRR